MKFPKPSVTMPFREFVPHSRNNPKLFVFASLLFAPSVTLRRFPKLRKVIVPGTDFKSLPLQRKTFEVCLVPVSEPCEGLETYARLFTSSTTTFPKPSRKKRFQFVRKGVTDGFVPQTALSAPYGQEYPWYISNRFEF